MQGYPQSSTFTEKGNLNLNTYYWPFEKQLTSCFPYICVCICIFLSCALFIIQYTVIYTTKYICKCLAIQTRVHYNLSLTKYCIDKVSKSWCVMYFHHHLDDYVYFTSGQISVNSPANILLQYYVCIPYYSENHLWYKI